MDETLVDGHDVCELCADIDNERALEAEEVSGEDRGFMHEEAIEPIFLEEKFDELLTVLFAAKWGLDVENRAHRGSQLHFLAQVEVGQCLESLPILDEAVIQNSLWVAVLLREGLVEVQLRLLPSLLVHLHILHDIVSTDGATISGRSLPA